MVHFVVETQRMLDRINLLIIGSHKSHMYNVAFFDCMQTNNVHVMAIPSHTSHIAQALDSTPFLQFKKNCGNGI